MSARVSPHPSTMIREEDAPVWDFRWPSPPLSSIEALWSAAATGAPRLLPLPHFDCTVNAGARTAQQPPPGFFLPINRDRGRCPSLCHPGFYYGGVSIPQSLLASHPLSVAFGDHQRCHRPRGTGKASALFVLFRWAVRTACLLAAANDVNILIASLWDVSTTAAALVYFIFSHHSSTVTPIILPLFSQIRRSVCAVASASLAGNWIHWIHFNIHYLGKRNSHLWSPAPPPQFLSLRPPK